jgi:hypothetical protein
MTLLKIVKDIYLKAKYRIPKNRAIFHLNDYSLNLCRNSTLNYPVTFE